MRKLFSLCLLSGPRYRPGVASALLISLRRHFDLICFDVFSKTPNVSNKSMKNKAVIFLLYLRFVVEVSLDRKYYRIGTHTLDR